MAHGLVRVRGDRLALSHVSLTLLLMAIDLQPHVFAS